MLPQHEIDAMTEEEFEMYTSMLPVIKPMIGPMVETRKRIEEEYELGGYIRKVESLMEGHEGKTDNQKLVIISETNVLIEFIMELSLKLNKKELYNDAASINEAANKILKEF